MPLKKDIGKAKVKRRPLKDYEGDCFIGIDAGSTTTKNVKGSIWHFT